MAGTGKRDTNMVVGIKQDLLQCDQERELCTTQSYDMVPSLVPDEEKRETAGEGGSGGYMGRRGPQCLYTNVNPLRVFQVSKPLA